MADGRLDEPAFVRNAQPLTVKDNPLPKRCHSPVSVAIFLIICGPHEYLILVKLSVELAVTAIGPHV
jgi:hypothetical protein